VAGWATREEIWRAWGSRRASLRETRRLQDHRGMVQKAKLCLDQGLGLSQHHYMNQQPSGEGTSTPRGLPMALRQVLGVILSNQAPIQRWCPETRQYACGLAHCSIAQGHVRSGPEEERVPGAVRSVTCRSRTSSGLLFSISCPRSSNARPVSCTCGTASRHHTARRHVSQRMCKKAQRELNSQAVDTLVLFLRHTRQAFGVRCCRGMLCGNGNSVRGRGT
jgi:hypothetical protein